jgi:hypothetical protein
MTCGLNSDLRYKLHVTVKQGAFSFKLCHQIPKRMSLMLTSDFK